MVRNIVLTIYVVITTIAIAVLIISNHISETGVIEIGNSILVPVENNILKPKTIKGDLVISKKSKKQVKKNDIISYATLEQGNMAIRTNKIVAIAKDSKGKNIYSLKKEDGTIENIDDSCILGIYKMTIPFMGTILAYLLSQQGFYTVVLIPAVILTIIFLFDFVQNLKKESKNRLKL